MSVTLPTNARGPILELTLPESEAAIDVVLRNVTTGKTLTINLPAEWDGDDLTLDFEQRTIVDQTGTDRSALLDAEDNALWSTEPLIAGENDVEIEAVGPIESQTKSPGTVADDSSLGSISWTNPSNAKASDNVYATAVLTVGQITHYLKATNFGFSIPEGVAVLGVAVGVEVKASSANARDKSVRLVKAGTIEGDDNDKLQIYGGADEIVSFGGESDLWGLTLTPANVNASTFGAAVAFEAIGSTTVSVDHTPITIYYRSPVAYGATATLRWEQGYS